MCGVCTATFSTVVGSNVHRAKMHGGGANNEVKQYVRGSVCPACQCDFRTRASLVQHLRPRPDAPCACRAFVLSGAVPLLDAAAAASADEADRGRLRRCQKRGVGPLAADGLFCVRPLPAAGVAAPVACPAPHAAHAALARALCDAPDAAGAPAC